MRPFLGPPFAEPTRSAVPGSGRVLVRTHHGGVDPDRPIIALGQVGPRSVARPRSDASFRPLTSGDFARRRSSTARTVPVDPAMAPPSESGTRCPTPPAEDRPTGHRDHQKTAGASQVAPTLHQSAQTAASPTETPRGRHSPDRGVDAATRTSTRQATTSLNVGEWADSPIPLGDRDPWAPCPVLRLKG